MDNEKWNFIIKIKKTRYLPCTIIIAVAMNSKQ